MTYRSLLTVFADESDFDATLDAAIALARRHDAHLEVLCTALGHAAFSVGLADIGGTAVIAAMQDAAGRSAALATRARIRLEREEIRWSVEDAGAQVMSIGDCVAPHARFADLVVLPRPLDRDSGPDAEAVTEAALFAGRAPVLIVPPAGMPGGPMDSIVIAWDGGDESMAAVRAAMPILLAAQKVSVAVVDPKRLYREVDDPGGAVARYLVRHGVRAEVAILARTAATVAGTLGQHLRDRAAELLVMGAYGHARLRERILGGTTRDVLRDTDVPVLLAR
jgi:nucleotide-binding universal stress UspA family protein